MFIKYHSLFKPLVGCTLFLLFATSSVWATKHPKSLEINGKVIVEPKHDGKHYFITPNQVTLALPTKSAIDDAQATAVANGRVIEIKTGGLSIPSAIAEVASLPVTFRSVIGGWNYDITVMAMQFTENTSRLVVGAKFTLGTATNAPSIYFGKSDIPVSGLKGFTGDLMILPETLTSRGNAEISTEAKALLNGKSLFYELPIPGFGRNLKMGLDEDTKMNFSCGMFNNFAISGYIKSYNTVEQENTDGATINAGMPYMLTFGNKTIADWQDIYLEAKPVNAFHASNFKDLGYQFAQNNAIVDLSIRQNPPFLPSCANVSSTFWQGVYFPNFDIRLPGFFTLKSGAKLPTAKGTNLFFDSKGLLGSTNSDKVFSLAEGTSPQIPNSDMSLDKVTAYYDCGAKVNAQMMGVIKLPSCNGSTKSVNINYNFVYNQTTGYAYAFSVDNNKIKSGNTITLASGSTFSFNVVNGQLSVISKTPYTPKITTDAYLKNAEYYVCPAGSSNPSHLTVSGCPANITWSDASLGTNAVVAISPTATTTYTAKCSDNNCVTTQTEPLVIKVWDQSAPKISANFDANPHCASQSSEISVNNNSCPGVIEWMIKTNGVQGTWTTNADELKYVLPNNVANATQYIVSTRCNLSAGASSCLSAESNPIEQNLKATPIKPSLDMNTGEYESCTPVYLGVSGCSNGVPKWYLSGTEVVALEGSRGKSFSEDGAYDYQVKCVNSDGCESELSNRAYFKINKCKCKPAPPVAQQPTQSIYEYGTTVNIHATDCAGTVTWYDASGQVYGYGSVIGYSSMGQAYFRATCTNADGCVSDLSGWVTVDIQTCINPPSPPTVSVVPNGNRVDIHAWGCSGTVVWYDAGNTAIGNGTVYTVYTAGTNYYKATCKNSLGCESQLSGWATVTINDPSLSMPFITATKTSINSGELVRLTANNCNGNILWINQATSVQIDVEPTQTFDYSLTCNGQTVWQRITVTNTPTPPTTISITASADSISAGTSVTLTAVGCTTNISWSGGQATPSITVSPTSTTTYTLSCNGTSVNKVVVVSAVPISVNIYKIEQFADPLNNDGITIHWTTTPSPNPCLFNIKRSPRFNYNNENEWGTIASNININSINFINVGVEAGRTYKYQVVAVNLNGVVLAESNIVEQYVDFRNISLLPPFDSYAKIDGDSIVMGWVDASLNEEYFELQYLLNGKWSGFTIKTQRNVSQHKILKSTGLRLGLSRFRVRSGNRLKVSDWGKQSEEIKY